MSFSTCPATANALANVNVAVTYGGRFLLQADPNVTVRTGGPLAAGTPVSEWGLICGWVRGC